MDTWNFRKCLECSPFLDFSHIFFIYSDSLNSNYESQKYDVVGKEGAILKINVQLVYL